MHRLIIGCKNQVRPSSSPHVFSLTDSRIFVLTLTTLQRPQWNKSPVNSDMDVLDPQHLFDNDKHLEDDQDCSFPDYEPGTTASEFDGAFDEDDENKEGGEDQKDEASESDPEIRTQRSSTKKVRLRFNFNLIILSRVSFVDWALEARCCTYLRGMIML